MTRLCSRVCAALLCAATAATARAATFQNLDFESPIRPQDFGNIGYPTVANAVPGWTVTIGTRTQTNISYNFIVWESAEIVLDGPPYVGSLQGNYDLSFGAIWIPGSPLEGSVYISQTGDIPQDARSLRYLCKRHLSDSPITVSVNGAVQPVTLWADSPAYSTYAIDISPWAGQSATLTFALIAEPPPVFFEKVANLDSISFSTTPVPEPASIAIVGLSLLLILQRRQSQPR